MKSPNWQPRTGARTPSNTLIPHMNSPTLIAGILIAALGLTFWLIARIFIRIQDRSRTRHEWKFFNPSWIENTSDDMVIIIESGGRIVSLSTGARELLNIEGEEFPNLENLARRLRPSEPFLALCTSPGYGKFVAGMQDLEVESHAVTLPSGEYMLLTLRNLQPGGIIREGAGQTSPSFLGVMPADMDLEPKLLMILQDLQKLVLADIYELTIWDPEKEYLVPFRVIGQSSEDIQLEKPFNRYRLGEGFPGALAEERAPLLIQDVEARSDQLPAIDRTVMPLRSYLGIPLVLGDELIGTMGIGSVTRGAFHQDDLDILQRISPPATVAIYNTLLLKRQQRRTAELSELAGLAQVFTTVTNPQTMYQRLVDSLAPLMPVEILGFLIYNESNRHLEGRAPIRGLPENFLELYSAEVPPNSPLEAALLEQDLLVTTNALGDPQWQLLGIDHLARGASLRDTVLIPLKAGGHALGYLQASNHTDGSTSFSRDELHLLMIVANQAAAIIENSYLVQQSRQRANRAEALRRVTSLASSAATTDEILKFSIQELARLLQADYAFALVLDEDRKSLGIHFPSIFGNNDSNNISMASLPTDDAQFPFTLTGSQSSRIIDQLVKEQAVIPFYQQLFSLLKLQSLIGVPLIVRDEGVGEVWFGSIQPSTFNQTDLQTMITAAGQLAGVVEQSFLVAQTDESLRRQVEQLTALTRISRELGTSLDLKSILQLVYSEALRITRADSGSILLFDLSRSESGLPIIRYSVGDSSPKVLSELEQQALSTVEPVDVPEISESSMTTSHGGVESTLIVPIHFRGKPAGLVLLHAHSARRFDEESIEITRSLAAQAAVALGNAFEYEEQLRRGELLKRQLEILTKLFQVSQVLRPGQPLEQSLAAIASAIQEVTRFQAVLINRLNLSTNMLERVYGLGIPEESWRELKEHTPPWRGIESLLKPEFRYGNVYFIPADLAPVIPEDVHLYAIPQLAELEVEDAWDPDDFLVVPLYDSQGHPLGTVGIDVPLDGRRPDRPTLEALDLLAFQVALVMENNRHVNELEQNLELTSLQARQAMASLEITQRNLPQLLNRNLEQTIAVRHLASTNERLLTGLKIAEEAARQDNLLQVLRTVADELLGSLGMQTALIGEQSPDGIRLLEVAGITEPGVNPQALFGQRNPLRQVLLDRKPILTASLDQCLEWKNNPMLHSLNTRGMLALPFAISDQRCFGILATSQNELPEITIEDEQIYDRLIRQVTVTLQNRNLLEETNRHLHEVNLLLEFTRRLGSLEQIDILNALLEGVMEVLPAAQSAWIALADEENGLTPLVAAGFLAKADLLAIRFPLDEGSKLFPVRIFHSGKVQRIADLNFASEYALPVDDLLHYRIATGGRLPLATLGVPLQLFGNSMGVLVIDQYSISGAFTADDETLVISLAQQTSLALENASLFAETVRLKQDLEVRVDERTAELTREHENSQTLLRLSNELSASLDIDQVLMRTLEILNATTGAEQSLIWLVGNSKHYLSGESLTNPSIAGALEVEIADWAARERTCVVVDDLTADERWTCPQTHESNYSSVIAVPLLMGQDALGALLLFQRSKNAFQVEQIDLLKAAARQISITINNSELFNLIRDQAENMGVMLRRQQMESSRMESILNAVADGVLVTDAKNRVTLFNPSAEKILKISSDEIVGNPLDKFRGLFGSSAQMWLGTIRSWLNYPKTRLPGEIYSEQIELDNGQIIAIQLAPVIWKKILLGTVTTFRDITHEVQVDRLKSEFVANVSHELRTPMTSIKGYVDIMLMGAAGQLNEQQKHFLEVVKSSSERLTILINDLLDLSRVETGRVQLMMQQIDLVDIMENVVNEMRTRSNDENKPITFTMDVPQQMPAILGDPERIDQIIGNLVRNGYLYTQEGGHVSIRIQLLDNEVQVDVQDDGVGIDPRNHSRIFERFYRGDHPLVLASAGTGLGLAMAKTLVEMHRGRIWFRSSGVPGEGSAFSFTLPIHRMEE